MLTSNSQHAIHNIGHATECNPLITESAQVTIIMVDILSNNWILFHYVVYLLSNLYEKK